MSRVPYSNTNMATWFEFITLPWRHMSVIVSQAMVNSTALSTGCWGPTKKTSKLSITGLEGSTGEWAGVLPHHHAVVVQSIWGQTGLNPPQIATQIKLALCCRGFCEDFRKQKFTKIKRVEHFQIAQFLCEPWGKILKKIGFGTFYQYGQIHVYFKSTWFMFVIKLLKTLYGMCVEQIIHWIRSPT